MATRDKPPKKPRDQIRQEQLDKAATRKAAKRLKVWNGVEFSHGNVSKLRCRLCNKIISSLVPAEEYEEVAVVNGKTIIYQRLLLAHTAEYAEIEISFPSRDGIPQKHVTFACVSCLGELTPDILEDIYLADVEQFDRDEAEGRGPAPWDVLERGKPTGFRRVV